MAFDSNTKEEICRYCYGHLPDNAWYEKEFDFIQDEALHHRLVEEF
ncbi:MAG: hypothetical protein IJT94_17505 [Oscillibacter sp.]|nr:hypothetical protein [Oscillibacter sp.]